MHRRVEEEDPKRQQLEIEEKVTKSISSYEVILKLMKFGWLWIFLLDGVGQVFI